MTRIEKEVIIRACAYYRDSQMRKATSARKAGENKRAAEHTSEASLSQAMVSEFCRVLDEPCGSCKI